MDKSCNELQSILDDDTYYNKSHAVFINRMILPDVSRSQWHMDMIDKILPTLKQSVELSPTAGGDADKQTLRCLGVGSGCGKTETLFLSKLIPHFPSIYQRAVEPNADQLGLYKKHVSTLGEEFNSVTFDHRLATVEAYRSIANIAPSTDGKFHFINAIHSAYHFQDIKDSLGYLYGKLEKHGVLLIEMNSEESLAHKIHPEIPTRSGNYSYSIGVVREYFNEQGIPFESYDLKKFIDMAGCSDDNITDDGNLLLDFVTRVRGFSKTSALPDENRKNINEIMRSEMVTQPDGREEVNWSNTVIMARR